MVKATQYLRMSTDMQDCSIAYQTAHNEAYARDKGYELVAPYKDEGISGLGIDRREGLQSLIASVVDGTADFSVVLVFDISRWGRFQNPDEAAYYEFMCWKAGVRIEYTSDPSLNDGTLTATLVKSIKRVMAAEFSRELSVRQIACKKSFVSRGYWPCGAAPYGYARQLINARGEFGPKLQFGERVRMQGYHGILVLGQPEQVATVRTVFKLYVRGFSHQDIANHLNAKGVLNGRNGNWIQATIGHLLKNELYAGVMVSGRWASSLGKQVKQPVGRQLRLEGFAEPIISKQVFARAQRERLRRKSRTYTQEEALESLRSTLKIHGKLTTKIIGKSSRCASVPFLRKAFGSLFNAYELIGYTPSDVQMRSASSWPTGAARKRGSKFSDEILLDDLRQVLRQNGSLTLDIIVRSKGLRSPDFYRQRFGSLRRVYALVGYSPSATQRSCFDGQKGQALSATAAETLRMISLAAAND